MARIISFVCILLLSFGWQQQSATGNPILLAKTALEFALDLYKDVKTVQEIFAAAPTENDQLSKVDVKMFERLDSISMNIRDLKSDIFEKISKDLQDKLSVKSDKLFVHIKNVQRLYKKFLKYAKNMNKLHKSTLSDFFHVVTSNSMDEMTSTIQKMHEVFADSDINTESILSILADRTNPELMCIRNQSPQQVIHDLYKAVVLTDTKGLVIKLFAYEKGKGSKEEYDVENGIEIEEFSERISNTYNKVKHAMALASREVWKCDPAQHKKDVTFSKIQEIFQGFINFERDTPENTCTNVCGSYDRTFSRCRSPFCQNQPKERRCTGHLRNCESISHEKTFCHSPNGSDRRYEWLETSSGVMYGVKSHCNHTQHIETEPAPEIFYYCEFCLCTCVSDHVEVDRYFSLGEAASDVIDNKVVTGVRFSKMNHVFHIQIQQGTLLANGSIDPESVAWKNVTNAIRDVKQLSYHYYAPPNGKNGFDFTEYILFKKNPHFYTVKWDQKTVYLDDVEPPTWSIEEPLVVTGLKFTQVDNDLRLDVETTPFDYATGKLRGRGSWHYNSRPQETRSALPLADPDNPLKLKRHVADSKSGQYVEFRTTDMRKDLGQYTVPFIDIQEVVSNPPVPLAGAGIFHKGTEGSGGFLALKLIQYNFTPHL